MRDYDERMMYDCCDDDMYTKGSPKWGYGGKYDEECDGMEYDCSMPKMKCKTTKECVKTFKTCYKLYKICTYRLFKVCSRCGCEFDYYVQCGACPKCR